MPGKLPDSCVVVGVQVAWKNHPPLEVQESEPLVATPVHHARRGAAARAKLAVPRIDRERGAGLLDGDDQLEHLQLGRLAAHLDVQGRRPAGHEAGSAERELDGARDRQ